MENTEEKIIAEYQLKTGKLGKKVVAGYKKAEEGVTGAYQKIEDGAAGLLLLLITLIVWRRMEGKEPVKLNGKTVGTVVFAIFGALLLGVGMCLSMVFGKMILGVIVGLAGIIALLMLIPLTKGLK